jgi:hypothetical protein
MIMAPAADWEEHLCFMTAWLGDFVRSAAAESEVLRLNGAGQAATARDRLIRQLLEAARRHYDEPIDVLVAAELTGRSPETIRRAVRKGAVTDLRPDGRGRHKLRRGDLPHIARPSRDGYDPTTDAQDIARRRSKV